MTKIGSSWPLAGVRVVEVSSYVAAPLGGMTLAQLGAEVIRIDPVGGAPDRTRWPLGPSGSSLYWAGLNKGKRSVVLDLKSAVGRQLAARLVTASGPQGGILLTNTRNISQLSYESLVEERADVIVVHVQGRRDGNSAVDYTVNAAYGFPLVTGPKGHAEPVNHVLPAWDVACGLYAAIGILAALRQRQLEGHGRQVRIPLDDVALAMAGNLGFLAEAQLNHDQRERIGNYVYGTFGRDFATGDGGRIMLVALTERHWRELVTMTETAQVLQVLEQALGTTFATEEGRFRHRDVIAAVLEPWFEQRTLTDVTRALSGTSMPWSRYRSFTDVISDGQDDLIENPMISEIHQPGVGAYLAPGSPLDLVDLPRQAHPAPQLGEHTGTVLSTVLGLSNAELADLQQQGVIADV